jgi:hypothetical protein
VASGAFVNKDRDAALKRMIYLAATRHSPEQDEAAAMAMGGGSSQAATATQDSLWRAGLGSLRRISLTTVSNSSSSSERQQQQQ